MGRKSAARAGARNRFGAALIALMSSASVFALAPSALAQAQSQSVTFDIPAQPIGSALVVFARQANVQLVMSEAPSGGAQANAVHGALSRDDALRQLLAGTGYQGHFENGAIRLTRVAANGMQRQGALENNNDPVRLAQNNTGGTLNDGGDHFSGDAGGGGNDDEIVVTGTNIRGVAPSSSPVQVYTAEDIARTGATTTEQFFRRLPQNLTTRTDIAPGSTGAANGQGVNSIDIRGLGVGTTLVLMNGRRLALTSAGRAADISLIPTSALARVEILTDGASAVYGSDAIGGVVNFVLRKDFDGAETRAGYGSVTDGALHQYSANQMFGRTWEGGNVLISYNYFDASPLKTTDRSYAAPAGPGDLTSDDRRQSLLATLSQDVTSKLTLSADLDWSDRNTHSLVTSFTNRFAYRAQQTQYFANFGADYEFSSSLHGALLATYTANDTNNLIVTRSASTSALLSTASTDSNYSAWDITAKLDGTLFAVWGGNVRFAAGGGLTHERYQPLTPAITARTIQYAFGELFVPLISADQGIPLAQRLELSIAARYTKYDDDSRPPTDIDFGGRTSPKFGILWAPIAGLDLRGTYGESFRAASLTETDRTSAAFVTAQIPGLLGGRPFLGVSGGPAGNLDPETAKTYTLGFDVTPPGVRGFRLGATYFHISYNDRIGLSAANDALPLLAPASYPDLVNFSPTVAQIESILTHAHPTLNLLGVNLADPAVAAGQFAALPGFTLVDNRLRNLSRSELDGLDLSVRYVFDTTIGHATLGLEATRLFSYVQQSKPTAPVLTVADTALLPVDLRGRGYFTLAHGGFEGTLSINYVDDYSNPFAIGGKKAVSSWTTADLNLSYAFGGDGGPLSGVRFSLSAQNLFDQDPPFLGGSGLSGAALTNPVGFDPINANPLGRFMAIELTKSW